MRGQRTDLDQTNEGILVRIKTKCIVQDNGCWIWTGSTNNKGRPTCSVRGKQGLSYRHAYMAFYSKNLPSEVYLCHHCDEPLCCNPEHLFEGDNKINQLDYISKNGSVKNAHNSGDTYINTGIRRIKSLCPSDLKGVDRLNWYKHNAMIIDKNNCWNRQRDVGRDGYGRIRYLQKKYATHRLFWALNYNRLEDLDSLRDNGVVFRHLCNNKRCCNPEHIMPGTRAENALDSVKYTYNEPIKEWLALYEIVLREESNLSRPKIVKGLRELGLVSENVSDSYVINVLRGKSHKHLHKEFFDWTPNWK